MVSVDQEYVHGLAGLWAAEGLTDGRQGAGWGQVSSEGSTREGPTSELQWLPAELSSLETLRPKALVLSQLEPNPLIHETPTVATCPSKEASVLERWTS